MKTMFIAIFAELHFSFSPSPFLLLFTFTLGALENVVAVQPALRKAGLAGFFVAEKDVLHPIQAADGDDASASGRFSAVATRA